MNLRNLLLLTTGLSLPRVSNTKKWMHPLTVGLRYHSFCINSQNQKDKAARNHKHHSIVYAEVVNVKSSPSVPIHAQARLIDHQKCKNCLLHRDTWHDTACGNFALTRNVLIAQNDAESRYSKVKNGRGDRSIFRHFKKALCEHDQPEERLAVKPDNQQHKGT